MKKSLKIKINYDGGEGEVLPVDEQPAFEGESDLFILDVLKDFVHDINQMYNKQHEVTFGSATKKGSLNDRLDK